MKTDHLVRWAYTIALPLFLYWLIPEFRGSFPEEFWNFVPSCLWAHSPQFCLVCGAFLLASFIWWLAKPGVVSGVILVILSNLVFSIKAIHLVRFLDRISQ